MDETAAALASEMRLGVGPLVALQDTLHRAFQVNIAYQPFTRETVWEAENLARRLVSEAGGKVEYATYLANSRVVRVRFLWREVPVHLDITLELR